MRKDQATPSPTVSQRPNLLTTREAMALLRIKTKNTLCGWVRDGKIGAIRMPDGSYRFDELEIMGWLQRRQVTPT